MPGEGRADGDHGPEPFRIADPPAAQRVFTPDMSNTDHLAAARELLGTGGPGEAALQRQTWPSPEAVALAQAHALVQIAEGVAGMAAQLTWLREALADRD
jgi:hypothetical protein